MDLMRTERHDRELARALGIRAKQENLGCDSVLGNPEMLGLCKGRDHRGVKMLVGAFVDGWWTQAQIQVTFGKRGTATFGTQEEAEKYLMALPANYAGRTSKLESGKWMVSYRRVATETNLMFPDQESARLYLEARMWPEGPRCPFCLGDRITSRKGGYYRCNTCSEGENFTVRTNTVMERSKIPLNKWVYAMYLLVTARKGISSMQLAKEIGVTKKSAWFMLHRLREACGSDDDLNKLSGVIEIDECLQGTDCGGCVDGNAKG